MIILCVTIVLIAALVCATICFIQREKTYMTQNCSEQQLIEDIRVRALNVFNRYLDDYNKALAEERTFYIDAKPLYTAIEDIIDMTIDYNKNNKD